MARLVTNGTTGAFDATAVWDTITNTPTLNASVDVTLSTSPSLSATFTAPNVINAATGVLIYLTNKSTANTITATLQEATVDTAHTVTVNVSDLKLGWNYLRPVTPYVFTAVTAGRYRWKLVCDTGSPTVAQATTANFAYLSSDNRNVAPGADNLWMVGANGTGTLTVTLTGTKSCGNTSVVGVSPRSITSGLIVSKGATLQYDQAATVDFTCTGPMLVEDGGQLLDGTTGAPLSASFTHTTTFAGSDQAANFNIATGATCILQGAPKSSTTLWKGTLASGVGTAASPLVLNESVDWSVGDEILVAASSGDATNYNQTESRFIITKNSATSYVVSSTSGGAETALTHTHVAGTLITNVQRNIIFKGTNGQAYVFQAQTDTTLVDVDWVRFQNISPTLFFGVAPTQFVDIFSGVSIDYCVAYKGGSGLFRLNANTTIQTHTGLIAYSADTETAGATVGLTGGFALTSVQNKTLVDCISMAKGGNGFALSTAYSNILLRCVAIASNFSNNITSAGGFLSSSSGQNSFADCEGHANRGAAVSLGTSIGDVFNGCLFGTKGINQTSDVKPASSTYNSGLFDSCSFGSADMISNYLNQTLGSENRFSRINDTDNVHGWFNTEGSAMSEQVVIRSPGLAVKIRPENTTRGFTWQFQTPVGANSIGRIQGYFLKNASLGTGVTIISLYLPDNPVSSGVPNVSYTLDNTTGATFSDASEQIVDISKIFTGDNPGVCQVLVNVKSATAGAALYCDDFFNSGNRVVTADEITGLNTWVDGKPITVITPSVPSAADAAAATWAYLKANATTVGSMGQLLIAAAADAELASVT